MLHAIKVVVARSAFVSFVFETLQFESVDSTLLFL